MNSIPETIQKVASFRTTMAVRTTVNGTREKQGGHVCRIEWCVVILLYSTQTKCRPVKGPVLADDLSSVEKRSNIQHENEIELILDISRVIALLTGDVPRRSYQVLLTVKPQGGQ